MTWRFQIIRTKPDCYGLHSVHLDKYGKPDAYALSPVTFDFATDGCFFGNDGASRTHGELTKPSYSRRNT